MADFGTKAYASYLFENYRIEVSCSHHYICWACFDLVEVQMVASCYTLIRHVCSLVQSNDVHLYHFAEAGIPRTATSHFLCAYYHKLHHY